ncbi:hypothetical protein LCGC14_2725240 [marine sediment metagenome]|uniref:HNH nuclease domain-containing protein n=1 Tax=marine sediment metagenome TaxID=412755 RepID=A0A0F9C0K4_9ZZZZ
MVYILKEPKIRKACVYCGKEFMTSWKNAKYCSRICANKRHRKKYNYPDKKEKKCIKCEKKFITSLSNQTYCSIKCREKNRDFYVDILNLREYIFERDNFTCQKCGNQGDKNNDLNAHHIIPLYKGGPHKVENIITLCVDCHRKEHKIW